MSNSKWVSQTYETRRSDFHNKVVSLKKQSRVYLYGKLLFFFCASFFIYSVIVNHQLLPGVLAAVFALLYIYVYNKDEKCVAEIRHIKSLDKVCAIEQSYLKGDFSELSEGRDYIDIQHDYAYDLDIFGSCSLFQRINRTITERGEHLLVKRLTHLTNDALQVVQTQVAVKELAEMLDWRICIMAHTKQKSHLHELSNTLYKEEKGTFLLTSKIPFVSVGIAIAFLVLAAIEVLPWGIFLLYFVIQLGVTSQCGKITSQSFFDSGKLHEEFEEYIYILEDLEKVQFSSPVLSRIREGLLSGDDSCLSTFRHLSKILNMFNQRNNEFMSAVLNGLFLYDIWLIRMFYKWKISALPKMEGWIDDMAELDVLVSKANFAFNHPDYVMGELLPSDDDAVLYAEGVFHPFLDSEKAVANDFNLMRDQASIVTGANMAGKSTFLRAVGVTYVLACNGMPVSARSYRFSLVSLFSSMRTADDLSKDISYFHAELLRLQQLLQHVRKEPFTLIILDEILKGTNSKDKLEGSVMFLNELSKYPMSVIVATHDLELARLEEQNPQIYHNYCFEIDLSETISYSYKIKNGVARNLNASYLLRKILERSK